MTAPESPAGAESGRTLRFELAEYGRDEPPDFLATGEIAPSVVASG